MRTQSAVALYALALVAVVVGVDILFFRHQFWERLIANVGLVLVFGAVYFEVPGVSASQLPQLSDTMRAWPSAVIRSRTSPKVSAPDEVDWGAL